MRCWPETSLDVLHTVELGFAATLCGSVLHCWAFPEGAPVKDANDRIAAVWALVQAGYTKLHTTERLSNLTVKMFCSGGVRRPWADAPTLKAHAGEIRHLVPVLALVATQRAGDSTAAAHMAAALQNLATLNMVCDSQDMFMTAESAEKAFTSMKRSLQHYAWLHINFQDTQRFPIRPKFHFCYHIAYFARYQNPRTSWCYKNEDWVGRLARIAHSCSHGTGGVKVSASLHQKYLVMLHLRLTNAITEM